MKNLLITTANAVLLVMLSVMFCAMAKTATFDYSDVASYTEDYAAATADAGGICWTSGENRPMPTEVMVTEKGGSAPVVLTSDKEIGIAINQVMGKKKVYKTVHQFCAVPKK